MKLVEYLLHSTFKERVKVSLDKSTNFRIEIITWGVFQFKVTIGTTEGRGEIVTHLSDALKEGEKYKPNSL